MTNDETMPAETMPAETMPAETMHGPVEIQITCGSVDEADLIAGALVERRVAACVQQLPIRSTYRWEGAVQHDDEILLLVKTTAGRFDEVVAIVRELHSYEVPAVTAVPIVGGSGDYLAWIEAETSAPNGTVERSPGG